MYNGIKLIRLGVGILAVSLITSHAFGLPHEATSFLMGMGCSLSIVGAGKRFVEVI
ncbi:MAG: hypothetical protein FWG87_11800 [Defluviitaleaceae bacterium]|nr:hypothetical protein [Defluviitaleaceae bacterium]